MVRAIANITARTGRSVEAARELLASGNPEGRIATVDEVAEAVLELINGTKTGVARRHSRLYRRLGAIPT